MVDYKVSNAYKHPHHLMKRDSSRTLSKAVMAKESDFSRVSASPNPYKDRTLNARR
jgi:hypothetical protein